VKDSDTGIHQGNVLIIDDEKDICTMLKGILEDENHKVSTAYSGISGLKSLSREVFDVVLLDVWLPDIDGVTLFERIKNSYPDVVVIMMSGHSNIETAIRCTKSGAFDFLEKPLSMEKIILNIQHALRTIHLKNENQALKNRVDQKSKLIGNSPSIKDIRQLIDKISDKSSTILITGENGTGKEVIARLIHQKSKRANKPFVALNCAAIPEELIESELFGHEKGPFTGANSQKRGKFEQAHSGTLFLDEIGDMSLKTQSKLLRAIQEKTVERIGGEESITVDVRIIAATNKNLEEEIKKQSFREDLYYRLNVIPIQTPALRDRPSDIPLLAMHFLDYFCVENNVRPKTISDEGLAELTRYPWPGNVRELKNIMERVSIIVSEDYLLPKHFSIFSKETNTEPHTHEWQNLMNHNDLREARNDFEKIFISKKLEQNEWNVSKTAEMLGLERSHLHKKIKQFGSSVEIPDPSKD
jgi:two-component system nitrogen regulation response regulator NtrX